MNSIFPWLGIAVLILCGWAIVKKYQVNMVLLLGGLILNLLAFWGGAEIFPKKFSATGIVGFDLIELLRTISVSTGERRRLPDLNLRRFCSLYAGNRRLRPLRHRLR